MNILQDVVDLRVFLFHSERLDERNCFNESQLTVYLVIFIVIIVLSIVLFTYIAMGGWIGEGYTIKISQITLPI